MPQKSGEKKARTKTIRQKAIIPAPPGEVFEVFMSAKQHAAFTGSAASLSRKVGGKFTAWDGYISGKNVKLVPGKRIVQEWMTTEWTEDDLPSTLDISLATTKGGTELVMVHSGVPARLAASLAHGWKEYYWRPLKEYFKSAKN